MCRRAETHISGRTSRHGMHAAARRQGVRARPAAASHLCAGESGPRRRGSRCDRTPLASFSCHRRGSARRQLSKQRLVEASTSAGIRTASSQQPAAVSPRRTPGLGIPRPRLRASRSRCRRRRIPLKSDVCPAACRRRADGCLTCCLARASSPPRSQPRRTREKQAGRRRRRRVDARCHGRRAPLASTSLKTSLSRLSHSTTARPRPAVSRPLASQLARPSPKRQKPSCWQRRTVPYIV